MPTPINTDPATYNSTTAGDFTLGMVVQWQGKDYQFVRVGNGAGDVACSDGHIMIWAATAAGGTTPGEYVTGALSGTANSSGLANNPIAGVGVGNISLNNYGFILVRGLHTNVKGTATITVGYPQAMSATAGTGFDQAAGTAETTSRFGRAATTLSGGRYSVYVGGM